MEKILIVDGNDTQRRLCEIGLRSEGYAVVCVRNGWAALLEIKTRMPDIVVLDIMIPGMDGIELLNKLISMNRKLPIVIHTATDDFRDNFMTWCADAYIMKSSDLMELKDKIRELLDKSKKVYV